MKRIILTSRLRRLLFVFCVVLLLVFAGWRIAGKNSSELKAHYTKYEFRIPMRDGVKLFTSVYVPKDTSRSYPFLVTRTPYGVAPYGPDNYPARLGPGELFDRAGYIFVLQDVRGRNQSEGEFIQMRPHIDHPGNGETDESTDMYDTVEWLLKNVSGNNGNVGIWGISYPGFYTSASIIDSHPAIKAASPQAPVTNLFEGDDAYHNGAFMLAAQFEFFSTFFKPRADGPEFPPSRWVPFAYGTNNGYEYFLHRGPDLKQIAGTINNPLFDETVAHDTEDDYWKARDISLHMKGINCAVLNVAGWFDAEDLAGSFRTYHAIERGNSLTSNVLVVGPWEHGAWARLPASSPKHVQLDAAKYYREHIVFPFFEHFLKGTPAAPIPEAEVFETGTNVWRQYDAWPPKDRKQKTLYLRANGKLSFDPPSPGESAFDEYTSDPEHPVPYIPYPATDVQAEYMFADQRFTEKRPDVLAYVSDPLEQDITIAGPVSTHLHVSSSGTDSDFDVKLIDVFPGNSETNYSQQEPGRADVRADVPIADEQTEGYEQLVRGEPMRAKFRTSWARPQPLAPNQITPLNFDMPDVNHTFQRGHRIMIKIQSSWFPLTDLNPQTFVSAASARPADFVKATERVYHTRQAASGIVIGVLPKR
jgi:putative CocE/NonD family hydrolase